MEIVFSALASRHLNLIHERGSSLMGSSDSKLEKQIDEELPLTERYYGFHNYGNTCYANSVLQALYFCPPFRMAIMNWTTQRAAQLEVEQEKHNRDLLSDTLKKVASTVSSNGPKEGEPQILTALSLLFDEIQSQKRRTGTIKPQQFISTLRRENMMFNSSSQQDAHEFLMYLLNEISESLEKQDKMLMKRLKQLESKELGSSGASRKSGGAGESDVMPERPNGSAAHLLADLANTSQSTKTFIQSIFQGTLTNDTRCLNCEMVTSREEHFLDVQVDIEQNSSVTHCLNKFTRVERLSGTNKFSCECCGSLQEAEKRTRFKSLPKILVLHLKRFKYLENPGIHAKLSHRVTFPVELRVPATMGSSAGPQTSSPANSIQYSQGDAPDPSLAESDDPLYYLSAMVAHLGPSAHSGHYVAFIRSGDKWLSMDDTRVQPVEDTETLMNRAFGVWNHNPEEPQNSASAYILFYERKPEVGRV